MTAIETSKEALWLRGLIDTFGIIHDSVQVFCNSQSAIHLAKNNRFHKRTKYIDVRHHMIHYWIVVANIIDLVKISMKKNLTDMMIKTIMMEKFRASLNFINVF